MLKLYLAGGLLNARHEGKRLCHPLPLKLEDKFRTDWFRVKGGRQQDLWPYQHGVALLEANSRCDALPIAKSLDHLLGKDYDTHAPRNGNNERSATPHVCAYPAYQPYDRWVVNQYRGEEDDLSETKYKAYDRVMLSAFCGGEKKIISQVFLFP